MRRTLKLQEHVHEVADCFSMDAKVFHNCELVKPEDSGMNPKKHHESLASRVAHLSEHSSI